MRISIHIVLVIFKCETFNKFKVVLKIQNITYTKKSKFLLYDKYKFLIYFYNRKLNKNHKDIKIVTKFLLFKLIN